MHESICPFKDHCGPIAAIVLSMAYHASNQFGDFGRWRVPNRQQGIRKKRSVCGDHSLTITQLLHSAENCVKVGFKVPNVFVKAARKSGCDGIVMASHGHGGLAGTILGSQTSRVLSHSKLPVLVVR